MSTESKKQNAIVIGFIVVSITVTGYFVGLQSPMNPGDEESDSGLTEASPVAKDILGGADAGRSSTGGPGVIAATSYSDMGQAVLKHYGDSLTSLVELKSQFDPLEEFSVTEEQKSEALARRDGNRAFNYAPPTIPHPVDELSTQSCVACHGDGVRTDSLRISKMSHQFSENCTQCHVPGNSEHMDSFEFRENLFVGLPAPQGGSIAFEGAPPTIPHSTWMRVNCMSCHGYVGQQGIRTTHPWRANCEQCHAPSSKLDQTMLDGTPAFLPPIPVRK